MRGMIYDFLFFWGCGEFFFLLPIPRGHPETRSRRSDKPEEEEDGEKLIWKNH
jgi:hypothetical protein